MNQSKRDKELTDTISQLITHAEPNMESLGLTSTVARSYRNNSIHAALHQVCSLYSDINIKEVVMLWSYVQLDDGTQFAYSETRDDGTVRVAVERPVDFDFDHAECFLPAVKWFNVEGFTADDLNFLTEFVRSNAPLIFELAERQKAGPAVA